MRTRKAQTLTPDFVISFVIFLALLTMSINLWNIANEKNTWIYDLEEMQLKTKIVADTLITRPGEPKDWNNETVTFIGFSDEDHILNKTKLISFKNIEYGKAKRLMNVGPNDFSLTITDKNDNIISLDPTITGKVAYFARQVPNDIAFLEYLNNYTGVWDFYFANGVPPVNNARNLYNSTDANKILLFKDLIDNISKYETIIYEDGHIEDIDLSAAEQQNLSDFVFNGGTYIHIQHKWELLRSFGFLDSDFGADKDVGVLLNKDPIVNGIDIGYTETFEQSTKTIIISSVPATMIIKPIYVDPFNNDLCLVCKFKFGKGNIYYMPDANQIGGTPIDGFSPTGISLDFSTDYTNKDYIAHSSRLALINDSGNLTIAKLNFVVWRDF